MKQQMLEEEVKLLKEQINKRDKLVMEEASGNLYRKYLNMILDEITPKKV